MQVTGLQIFFRLMVSLIYPRAPHCVPGNVQGPQPRITSSLPSICSSLDTSLFPFSNVNLSPEIPTHSSPRLCSSSFLVLIDPYPLSFNAYMSCAHLLRSGSNSLSSPTPAWPLKRTAILPSSYLPSVLLYYAFGYMFSQLLTCLGWDLGGIEGWMCL